VPCRAPGRPTPAVEVGRTGAASDFHTRVLRTGTPVIPTRSQLQRNAPRVTRRDARLSSSSLAPLWSISVRAAASRPRSNTRRAHRPRRRHRCCFRGNVDVRFRSGRIGRRPHAHHGWSRKRERAPPDRPIAGVVELHHADDPAVLERVTVGATRMFRIACRSATRNSSAARRPSPG
jgi:hypothetical protein